MAAHKENDPLNVKAQGNCHVIKPKKLVSRIPVPVSRVTRAPRNVLQNVETKLNTAGASNHLSTTNTNNSKLDKQDEVIEFVPDPKALNDILTEKPITMTTNQSRQSKCVLPFLDDTPACVRMSVYRNRNANHHGQTPLSVSHKTRVNLLCERMVQSTARLCDKRRETITHLDDLSLNLNNTEFTTKTLPRSPSHPLLSSSRRRQDTVPRSPSLPDLSYTPLTRQVSATPLYTKKQHHCSAVTVKQSHNEDEIEEFVPDPKALNDILTEKPITMTTDQSRQSKCVLPFLDDTPACVRMSVYRNRNANHHGQTPLSVSHKTRVNLLCERMVQSTARLCDKRRETITHLDDLSLNLNNTEFTTKTLPRSPSHPLLSNNRRRQDTVPQSPSLPDLSYTPLTRQASGITTPLHIRTKVHSSLSTQPTSTTSNSNSAVLPSFYDIDSELVSILRHVSRPCGLSRNECINPVAKQLYDYDF